MTDKALLQLVINDQRMLTWQDNWLTRELPEHLLKSQDVVVISGIRRCGKSTLLHQIRKNQPEKDYYLNFDDDRLVQFTTDDFQLLYELFISLFGKQQTFYFDEIQNVKGWERFVRRLHDYGNKIFITGSNASMLSRELGTHLTGRFLSYELFPFSFSEYLQWSKIEVNDSSKLSTEARAGLIRQFDQYFIAGGFPAYLREQNPQYLKTLYENILYRDVLVRNKLTNEKELLELVFYLASNVAKLNSYSALTKTIGVANPTTIKNYLSFLEDAYLVFSVNKLSYSVKTQLRNPKKVYLIDLALVRTLGFHFTDDRGRFLENLVFLELKRGGRVIFYHQNKFECDFIIRDGAQVVQAIQVTYSMQDGETHMRELNGLLEAMEEYQLNTGLIITDHEEKEIDIPGKTITIVPAWKWLLDNKSN
ncbi:MAG: ATPase [Bacteroidetes bacterium GWF2_41_31]|nr:MAG: ATPase [Bacteroidetes bacterium GWF2_41_31]OFZ06593.1 MAG: ATPase [Bacteroidetes bacterium RIFOXYB12_FULL_41_6]